MIHGVTASGSRQPLPSVNYPVQAEIGDLIAAGEPYANFLYRRMEAEGVWQPIPSGVGVMEQLPRQSSRGRRGNNIVFEEAGNYRQEVTQEPWSVNRFYYASDSKGWTIVDGKPPEEVGKEEPEHIKNPFFFIAKTRAKK